MSKIWIYDLTGPALDWAVAIAMGWDDVKISGFEDPDIQDYPFFRPGKVVNGREICGGGLPWEPSTNHAHGGPIMDDGTILEIIRFPEWATPNRVRVSSQRRINYGPTILVAGMRCIVSHHLGNEIEVPEVLAKQLRR